MASYRRKSQKDGYYRYYRCQPASPSARKTCPNQKSHQADDLEARAARIPYDSFDPKGEMYVLLYNKYKEEKRKLESGSTERRAALVKQL